MMDVHGRRRAGAAVLGVVLAAGLATTAPAPPARAAVPARAADAVVGSMCVNVHPWYDWDVVPGKLVDLGIRCVRDGTDQDPALYRSLYEDHGVRVLLITDYRKMDGAQVRDYVKAIGPEAVVAVENNNEPRGFVGGDRWAQDTRAHQIDLFRAINGDPATAGVPVATSSPLSGGDVLAVGDVSDHADYGNVHNYLGGHHPESGGWGDDGYGSLDWQRRFQVEPAVGDKPFISSETGYHNALASGDGHRPATEEAAGTYMPRLYLHQFQQGVALTAPYEFWDQGTNDNHENRFGMLRHDYSPKPAYTAVRNLIALLADPGPAFTPGALDYTLSGDTGDVEQLLLQRRDGTFYLALWQGVESYRVDEQQDVDVPDVDVTLELGRPAGEAATCRPNQGAACTAVAVDDGRIALSVPDEVLLVRLGGGGQAPPAPVPPAPAPAPPAPAPAPVADDVPVDAVAPPARGDAAGTLWLERAGAAVVRFMERALAWIGMG